MIRLYQFAPAWELPNASPFCMKVETYLRMAGLPYETVSTRQFSKAPKGKLPYIEDNGTTIGDSSFIIDYLKSKYGDSTDQDLTVSEFVIAHALRRMLEESLYWAAAYSRWGDSANWGKLRAVFFDGMPFPLRAIVPRIARKIALKNMAGQGITNHPASDIYAIGKADISALSNYLADKPFLMGQHPTSLDASAYAFLANIIWVPVESPLKQHTLSLANLTAYCERMQKRYYSDWRPGP